MFELVKIIKTNIYKWRNTTLGNFYNFTIDQIIPNIIFIYYMCCGVLSVFYLKTQGVTNKTFKYIMLFFGYVIITRKTNTLAENGIDTLLEKMKFALSYLFFSFIGILIFFAKLLCVNTILDNFTITYLGIITTSISIIIYPNKLRYCISKYKETRKIVINALTLGLIIDLVLSIFFKQMLIFATVQIYFIISVTVLMRNFKAEEYSENSFGIIVRNRSYPMIKKSLNKFYNLKNKASEMITTSMYKKSKLIKPIVFKLFINIAAITIEILLSHRAYDMFYKIIILPDSNNPCIYLEAVTLMAIAILISFFQILYLLTEYSYTRIKVIDINTFFLGILFITLVYQIIHAPVIMLLSIILYLVFMTMMVPLKSKAIV